MKSFIDNRQDQKICVLTEGPQAKSKLAFVMHGLGGDKSRPPIRAMADSLLQAGYTVVTFDTTCSFGESEGSYQDATVTQSYADLEDVIDWAAAQSWYSQPFILAGHSLGGICTALYAEKYPRIVKALAPISTLISGELSFETHRMFPEIGSLNEWRRDGIRVTMSRDGQRGQRLKWSHMEDRLKYDLLPRANQLRMPVLLVVGEKDQPTPQIHQQILFDALPGPKEIHVIAGAEHSFYKAEELLKLKKIFKNWLETLDQ